MSQKYKDGRGIETWKRFLGGIIRVMDYHWKNVWYMQVYKNTACHWQNVTSTKNNINEERQLLSALHVFKHVFAPVSWFLNTSSSRKCICSVVTKQGFDFLIGSLWQSTYENTHLSNQVSSANLSASKMFSNIDGIYFSSHFCLS